jgi:hypothetical protein
MGDLEARLGKVTGANMMGDESSLVGSATEW